MVTFKAPILHKLYICLHACFSDSLFMVMLSIKSLKLLYGPEPTQTKKEFNFLSWINTWIIFKFLFMSKIKSEVILKAFIDSKKIETLNFKLKWEINFHKIFGLLLYQMHTLLLMKKLWIFFNPLQPQGFFSISSKKSILLTNNYQIKETELWPWITFIKEKCNSQSFQEINNLSFMNHKYFYFLLKP